MNIRGRPALLRCYVCNHEFQNRQLLRIGDDENELRRQTSVIRQAELHHEPLELGHESRLCLNCNTGILQEITQLHENPTCLNVSSQAINSTCVICNAAKNLHRLSIDCRAQIYIDENIYIPPNVRLRQHHLDENGLFFKVLLTGLRSINRPY